MGKEYIHRATSHQPLGFGLAGFLISPPVYSLSPALLVDAVGLAQGTNCQSAYLGSTSPREDADIGSERPQSVFLWAELYQSVPVVMVSSGDDEFDAAFDQSSIQSVFIPCTLKPGPIEREVSHVQNGLRAASGCRADSSQSPTLVTVPVAGDEEGLGRTSVKHWHEDDQPLCKRQMFWS